MAPTKPAAPQPNPQYVKKLRLHHQRTGETKLPVPAVGDDRGGSFITAAPCWPCSTNKTHPEEEAKGRGLFTRFYGPVRGDWSQVGETIGGAVCADGFGNSIAMSADGQRCVVGTQGKVRVLQLKDGDWCELGNELTGPGEYGRSVALNGDGSILAIGAPSTEGGNANETAGAVYVYKLAESNEWEQVAELQPQQAGAKTKRKSRTTVVEALNASFGFSVSLSSDGKRLAASSPNEGGGVVRIYEEVERVWSIATTLDGTGEPFDVVHGDRFGHQVALSADGDVLAAGAPMHGDGAGMVAVYERVCSADEGEGKPEWTPKGEGIFGRVQTAIADPCNPYDKTTIVDNLGWSVALSGNGSRLAAGAPNAVSVFEECGEVYKATPAWAAENQTFDGIATAGYVEVLEMERDQWRRVGGLIIGDGSADNVQVGTSVALSDDGEIVAVGAPNNGPTGSPINGTRAAAMAYKVQDRAPPTTSRIGRAGPTSAEPNICKRAAIWLQDHVFWIWAGGKDGQYGLLSARAACRQRPRLSRTSDPPPPPPGQPRAGRQGGCLHLAARAGQRAVAGRLLPQRRRRVRGCRAEPVRQGLRHAGQVRRLGQGFRGASAERAPPARVRGT